MDLVYVVNRASAHPREVDVTYNGQAARAMMTELEVEMYDPEGKHGTITMRFSAAEMAEAKAFVAGATVTVSLSAFQVTAPSLALEVAEAVVEHLEG